MRKAQSKLDLDPSSCQLLIRIQQASTVEAPPTHGAIKLSRAVFVCSNTLSCLSALPHPLSDFGDPY